MNLSRTNDKTYSFAVGTADRFYSTDDAVIVAFVLRRVLRGSGPELIEEHWPGPPTSLALVLRLAGFKRTK